MSVTQITQQAKDVLSNNDLGKWTRPTKELYPHQWLWDSCFIAVGMRHIDITRAQDEVRSLFRGQWANGMVPHIVFSEAKGYHAGPTLWRADRSPNAPKHIETTGISQPPMLAEAIVRIGSMLGHKERHVWYSEMYPLLAKFHTWLYTARDPERTGLVTLVHPWESGLDNSPPWMEALHTHAISRKLQFMEQSHFSKFVELFRKDTSIVPASQRMSTLDLHAVYALIRDLRRFTYDDELIFKQHKVLVVDVVFNSILIRANDHLAVIAKTIGAALPPLVQQAHDRGVDALDQLWDEKAGQYYCMDYRTKQLIKEPSVATFLPLYAGELPAERVRKLRQHLQDPMEYGMDYSVASTPLSSLYFKPLCYWQGPVWFNINWLLIDGLRRNGSSDAAQRIRDSMLLLVKRRGMREYFSPLDGSGAGAPYFSWTAALTLDLLAELTTD